MPFLEILWQRIHYQNTVVYPQDVFSELKYKDHVHNRWWFNSIYQLDPKLPGALYHKQYIEIKLNPHHIKIKKNWLDNDRYHVAYKLIILLYILKVPKGWWFNLRGGG